MLEVLLSVFLVTLSLYLYLTWNFDHWRQRGVNGPVPRAYIGTFPKTALFDKSSNYITETTEIYQKYFRHHRFIGVFEYRTPNLLILDPSLAVEIYVKYFKYFGDNSMSDLINGQTDPLFKPNPFIEKLNEWKERRTELTPAFTALKVKAVYPALENSCYQLIQFLGKRIKAGQQNITSKEISNRVIGDMVCNIIFGLDANGFDETSDFVEHGKRMFHSTPYDNVLAVIYSIFPFVRHFIPRKFVSAEFAHWFVDLFDIAVKLRKRNNIKRDDYLNFLLELKDRKHTSPELLYAQAFTFFLDGFETSSYMLSNALNLLAQNKECQQKLRNEITGYKNISHDDLCQLPYLDGVLNETTRISPFPFSIWKNCTKNIELTDYDGKTVLIEEGTKIILPVNALHSHPDFYDNPETFDPDRYAESTGGIKRLKDAGVFMPFGNGPRSCLGIRFAKTMIKASLHSIITNFDISIQPSKTEVSPPTGMLFFSENSTTLKIESLHKE